MERFHKRLGYIEYLQGGGAAREGRAVLWQAAGLSIFWLWPWLLSEESARTAVSQGLAGSVLLWIRLCFFLFLGLLLVALAVFYKRRGLRVPRRWTPGVSALCLVLAAALTLVLPQFVGEGSGLFVAMASVRSLLAATGVALLCVECGSVAGVLGARTTMLAGIAGTLVSVPCFYGVRLFSPAVSQLLIMVLAVMSFPAMTALVRVGSAEAVPEPKWEFASQVRVPWKLTITTVVWTATYGAISAVFDGGAARSGGWLVAYGLGALLLLACLTRSRMNFNDLIYKVGFVGAAAGIAAILFARELLPAGYFLFMVGCRFVELLVWGLFANLVGTRGLSAYWTTSLNVGIWTLGRLAGFTAAAWALGIEGEAAQGMPYTVALAAELVILVGALFLSSRSNFAEGWGMERVVSGRPGEHQVDHCCATLGAEHGLTQREIEVLRLIVKGATRPEISERLCISLETARTHARHIYQKLGVGSREAVVELVESMLSASREY